MTWETMRTTSMSTRGKRVDDVMRFNHEFHSSNDNTTRTIVLRAKMRSVRSMCVTCASVQAPQQSRKFYNSEIFSHSKNEGVAECQPIARQVHFCSKKKRNISIIFPLNFSHSLLCVSHEKSGRTLSMSLSHLHTHDRLKSIPFRSSSMLVIVIVCQIFNSFIVWTTWQFSFTLIQTFWRRANRLFFCLSKFILIFTASLRRFALTIGVASCFEVAANSFIDFRRFDAKTTPTAASTH